MSEETKNTAQEEETTETPVTEETVEQTSAGEVDEDGVSTKPATYKKTSHTYQDGTVPVTETIEVAAIGTGKNPPKITYTGNGGAAPSSTGGGKKGGGGGGKKSGTDRKSKRMLLHIVRNGARYTFGNHRVLSFLERAIRCSSRIVYRGHIGRFRGNSHRIAIQLCSNTQRRNNL